MRKTFVLFLVLALLLTACGLSTPQPATQVTAMNTLVQPDATDSVTPTGGPNATDVATPDAVTTGTQQPVVGGGFFDDITRTNDSFSLRCAPSEILFSLKVINPSITQVLLYYRVVDKASTSPAGAMVNNLPMDKGVDGVFTLNFKASDVKEDLRLANGWFEYQFVGFNKGGNVVGRSEKIVKQVTFTIGCP